MPHHPRKVRHSEDPEWKAFHITVGAIVLRWRRIRRLDQYTMAHILGYTQPYIHYIEKGKRGMSLELAIRVAAVLNIPVSTFLPGHRERLARRKKHLARKKYKKGRQLRDRAVREAKQKKMQAMMRRIVAARRREAAKRERAALAKPKAGAV